MNRLVIIGNGFDLANGLKSRYEDFLVWYLKESFRDVCSGRIRKFENELLNVQTKKANVLIDIESFSTIDEFLNHPEIFWPLDTRKDEFKIQIRVDLTSILFSKILEKRNWTDIEYIYFNTISSSNSINSQKAINRHLEVVKTEFVKYLKLIKDDFRLNNSVAYFLNQALTAGPPFSEFYTNDKTRKMLRNGLAEGNQNETLVLNFNYTNLFRKVSGDYFSDRRIREISIHGNLENQSKIIFGYGDEMAANFRSLQEKNNNELIKNFKSYHYAADHAYLDLLGFVKQGVFDVVVIGHSLGLSDRVLLNTIFEDENCKYIHLFHRGSDSHFKMRMALGRHFNDPAKFREKLMPENKEFEMPR